MPRLNEFGQTIGDAVPGWTARPSPPATPMQGRLTRLEPLDATRHAKALYEAHSQAPDGRSWTYVPDEPPSTYEAFAARIAARAAQTDLVMNAILDLEGRALG